MTFLQKINIKERVNFAKGFAVMIRGSVSINESLSILASQTKSRAFKKFLLQAKDRVEKGTSLSEVFAGREKQLGGVFVNFVKAGEASGSLERNLDVVADWMDRDYDLKREVKSATLYPKFILVAAFALSAGLTVFVLPRLIPMFTQLDVELPLPTIILMAMSSFVQNHTMLLMLIIFGVIAFFWFLNQIRSVRKILHTLYLRSPFFAAMVREYQLALIAHLLATLFESGTTLNESLKITQQSTENLCYEAALFKIRQRIQKGTSLSEALAGYPALFPDVFRNLVLVGEKTGSLHESFTYLAEFYTKEVKSKAKRLPVIIEPVLLIAIGVIVLFVAAAIITPIYELTSGV
jgi:type IV pilus assembly protein PilC